MYHRGFLFKILKLYDKLVVFIFCTFVFNRSRQSLLQTVERFGDTEDDTVWQLFWGIKRIENHQIRATLFQQILEETYHAEEFYAALNKLGASRNPHSSYERKSLYGENEPVWKLILYCHIGEAEAEMRFRHFLQFCKDKTVKRSVGKVLADEVGHVNIAYQLLEKMNVSKQEIQSETRRIFWRRRLDSLKFKLKTIGSFVFGLILTILYFALGPFVRRACQRRLDSPLPVSQTDFEEVRL